MAKEYRFGGKTFLIHKDGYITDLNGQKIHLIEKPIGYYLSFKNNGKLYSKSFKSIYGECFIDNPEKLKYIQFKNNDNKDIRIENMYWSKYNHINPYKDPDCKIFDSLPKYENEEWRYLEYAPDYLISNYGRVYSKRSGCVLKTWYNHKGYKMVEIRIGFRKKAMYIHRLVALAFIPNPYNYPEVNHKDEDKENNHVNNLEWCTSEYNSNYGTRNERLVYSHWLFNEYIKKCVFATPFNLDKGIIYDENYLPIYDENFITLRRKEIG